VRYLLGNVKKDGNLSFEDLMIIQTMILYQEFNLQFPFTPEDYIIADLNKDGRVSSLELLQIQRLILGLGYSFLNNTINIEQGNFIAENIVLSTTNPVKISGDIVLEENSAYGFKFNSDATGSVIFGTYALEINIPTLNENRIGFSIDRYNGDYQYRIYVYQDLDGIYLLRCIVNNEFIDDEFVEVFDFDVSKWGSSELIELYEINTSD
jgi:hypothetical protein